MKTATMISNIQPKSYTRFGVRHEPKETMNTYNAEVVPEESIRIFGTFRNLTAGPQVFSRIFKVGDKCEYDSYNTSYIGSITAIGKSTVAVKNIYSRNTRLDLHTFCWRNWDFDEERIERENAIELQYI